MSKPYETAPNGREQLEELLQIPIVLKHVREVEDKVEKYPNSCITYNTKPIKQVRVGGKRRWVSIRTLVWIRAGNKGVLSMAPATCGTVGCMNPAHQKAPSPPHKPCIVISSPKKIPPTHLRHDILTAPSSRGTIGQDNES